MKDITNKSRYKPLIYHERLRYVMPVVIMGIFTFLFLGAEYLYDNMIALFVSRERTVLAQNYALGISTLGFLLYPTARRIINKKNRIPFSIISALVSVICIIVVGQHVSYVITIISGFILFLFLGLTGSCVFYTSMCVLKNDRYLARTVGVSYMLGILLQFANNNLINSDTIEAVVLSAFMLVLICLLSITWQDRNPETSADDSSCIDYTYAGNGISGNNGLPENNDTSHSLKALVPGLLMILLIVLMTCIFSTLDNAVTLEHAAGTMDIGQWPRILLALSGLAAGFIYDFKNRKYMFLSMYCVMILSTLCIAVPMLGSSFLTGLVMFYISAGFFAVFFTTSFMELACYMNTPELWAGLGRAVNNITAALIANTSLKLLSSGNGIAIIVTVLVLFVSVILVAAAYSSRIGILIEGKPIDLLYSCSLQSDSLSSGNPEAASLNSVNLETAATSSCEIDKESRLHELSELYSFTPREAEVFGCLVNTDDSLQTIADNLFISKRTLERYISGIYKKTEVKSRSALVRLFNDKVNNK